MLAKHVVFFSMAGLALAQEEPEVCPCLFSGKELDSYIYTDYPEGEDKGKYKNASVYINAHIYGTHCGAWDMMPGTPWHDSCTLKVGKGEDEKARDWYERDNNWCQVPWCYVECKGVNCAGCKNAFKSDVFKGSPAAYYSYQSCGAPDCYTDIAWNDDYGAAPWPLADGTCPYDPSKTQSYRLDTFGNDEKCRCTYHGQTLPSFIPLQFPDAEPGKYKNVKYIESYGTSCVAWDQIPGTPWHDYCTVGADGADYCNQDFNWCQTPWCYVDKSCPSAVASSVFKSTSDVPPAFYSYSTCSGNTPDCYSNIAWDKNALENAPAECPFDSTNNGWYTMQKCPQGWMVRQPAKTTCGKIKEGYRANECCNKPESPYVRDKEV